MNTQNKKFISPGAWFSLSYPSNWNEFEDMENCFLFYNPVKWTGNFRISAFKAGKDYPGYKTYGEDSFKEELSQNQYATKINVAGWDCAYYKETFQEEGTYYTTHFWVTGKSDMAFECSFTVLKGEDKKIAEDIIGTLQLRESDCKYPVELIPVRVLEIGVINEAYEWASTAIKKMLKKDFTASLEDIPKIQHVIDNGDFKFHAKEACLSLGIAFGAVILNEIDGMEWVTVIDSPLEFPALRYEDTDIILYPMQLTGESMGGKRTCDLAAEFENIKKKVEDTL